MVTARSAEQVVTPITARAIVLDDGRERLGIVVVDSCMMSRDLIDRARSSAPDEVRDAVNTLADNTNRLFDAVEGANFDVTQISDEEVLELTQGSAEAQATIEVFCAGQAGGDDDSSADDSAMVDDGGAEDSFEFEDDGVSVGGAGNIPDDFPDELVPPTYDEVTTLNLGGTRSVSFTITDVDYATVRDHYLGVLGDPAFELNSGDGSTASWSIGDPTTGQNVSVFDGGDGSVLVTATDLSGG